VIPQRLEVQLAVQALLAEYGGLLDLGDYDDWLALFAAECRYAVVPRENHDAGLPVALILCDNRAMLEDRIAALRQANKYNLHTDRHIIGLPRIVAAETGRFDIEAPFAVYQTNQEGETILFATGLYRDRLERGAPERGAPEHGIDALRIAEKLVLLDTFAVPTLLATPL
jgi:anthranilate 1,2-dioxygenase small subunit